MRVVIAAMLCAVLAGCVASGGVPRVDPETLARERKVSGDRLLECALKGIRELDDGVSSADAVAGAALGRCRPEMEEVCLAATGGRPAGFCSPTKVTQSLAEMQPTITAKVLEFRVGRRLRGSKAAPAADAKETPAEREAGLQVGECASKAIGSLDDGVSSADVIAEAVQVACRHEIERVCPAFAQQSVVEVCTPAFIADMNKRWRTVFAAKISQFRYDRDDRDKPRSSAPPAPPTTPR